MCFQLRVLFFGTYFEFKGKETYITEEITEVIKHYPDVEYIVYTVGPFYKENRTIRYNDKIIWIQRKNLKNFNTLLLFLKDMIKIFIKFKPNIIHSVYVMESLIMGILSKVFQVPSIFHSRGMDFNYYPFIKLKSNILARIVAKLNNIIITVSKSLKIDGLRLNIPSKKIIPIYDGINISMFNPIEKKSDSLKKRFEILHIGRFEPVKCHKLIIETCKKLRDNNINFHLTFTGYGSLEKDITNLIKKYELDNWITIAGYTDHDKIPNFLSKGDLYIHPSLSETLGISILEAMSMELPVILTRKGGMVELNVKPGVIFIEPNNKKQLYDAILYYKNNPEIRQVGGKKNREFVLKNFNWETHAKKLIKVYKMLTKNPN